LHVQGEEADFKSLGGHGVLLSVGSVDGGDMVLDVVVCAVLMLTSRFYNKMPGT
jgi:hypothetical protein